MYQFYVWAHLATISVHRVDGAGQFFPNTVLAVVDESYAPMSTTFMHGGHHRYGNMWWLY